MRNFTIIFFFTILVLSAYAEPLKKLSLQLQWKHQFEFAGFYIAKEKGYYEEAGIDLEIKEYIHGTDIIKDVTEQKAAFGTNYPSLILERSKNKPIVVLGAVLQSSPHVLVSLKSSGINSVKDFKGKKIMINNDAVQTASFLSMLRSQGLSFDDMTRVDHTFNINDLIEGKVDITTAFRSNELYILDKMGLEYNVWDPKDYGFDFYDVLGFTSEEFLKNNRQLVIDFKRATKKGWIYAFNNIEETVDLIFEKYNTQNKTKKALLYEANVLKKLAFDNNGNFGSITKERIVRISDIYNILGLIKNKIDMESFIFDETKVLLSDEEKRYLQKNPLIKMCNNPNWKPLEFKENGKMGGVVIDILKLVEKRLDVKIEHLPTKDWKESQQFLEEGKCDIIPAAIKTDKRSRYADFTQPYLNYKLAIITTKDKPFISSIEEIVSNGRTIARKKASGLIGILKNKYPDVKIVETEDYLEALQKVSKGEVYCTIATLPLVSYYMNEFALNNLQIAGYTNMHYELSIAVTKNKPLLTGILSKTLKTISKKEQGDIYSKWSNVKIEEKFDYRYLVYSVIFLMLITLVIIFRQYFLNRQNALLKKLVEERTRQLEEEKNRFQMAIEGSNEGIFDWDLVKGTIYFSPRWKAQIGYEDNELKNDFSEWEKRVYPDDLPIVMAKINDHFEGKTAIFEASHRLKHKLGHWVWIEARAKALKDEKGKVLRLVGSHNDITELVQYRKSLENRVKEEVEKNRKNELRLLEQSKMVSLGNMIGNIAHQWRQPLSVITTATSAIQLKREMDELDGEYLDSLIESIDKNVMYLSNTIDTFRNFIKEEKVLKEVIVQDQIDKTLNILNDSLKNNHIKLINEIDYTTPLRTKLIVGELDQVIMNIVNNAKDALIEKGIDDPWIKINLYNNDEKITLTIEDNGKGIDPEVMPYIFDPYFTTKHQSVGTGLGLHMSYKIIVESLKGKIYAKNTDNGVRFYIQIPLKGKSL